MRLCTVEFRPAHREEILNVARAFRVVCKFVVVFVAEMFGVEPERNEIIPSRFFVLFVIFEVGAFFAEPLMFHLLEFDSSENEVTGRDFVSERLTYLRYAERNFGAHTALNVLEVYEFSLRRFGAKINLVLIRVCNAPRSFEHKVEVSYRRPVEFAANRAFNLMFVDVRFHFFVRHRVGVDFAVRVRFDKVVRAFAGFTFLAVHFGVGETRGVSRGFPYSAVHKYSRVHAEGVFAFLNESLPPTALDVVLYLNAYRTVVPGVAHAAVNITAREDDSALFAEVYEFVHSYGSFFFHKNNLRLVANGFSQRFR